MSAFVALATEAPLLVSYQGVLRNAADKPLTGTFDVIFRFVDAPSGGTLLLTDLHTGPNGVVATGGLFTTNLGGGTLSPGTEATLLAVFGNHPAVYVEIQVGAETLSPRVQVVSAAYALNAGRVGGVAATDFLDKSAVAQVKLGALTASGISGTGVGTGPGVYGSTASTAGTGVVGEATATTGAPFGVHGKTVSTAGVGVLGSALATSGNTEGMRGQSTSPTGKGVVGGAFATTGVTYGMYGEAQSPDGFGVYGHNVATSGGTTGVGGETFSSLGTAVAGVAHAASGDAWGVYGGTTSPTGFGVVAEGGMGVIGDLVVTGAKDFVTEHPGAPDKEIRYACIEGGEVGVYHRGTGRLKDGEAHVVLPADFPLVASGTITVQVTPHEATRGLYVPEASVTTNGFAVREQGGGTSDSSFSYVVMAGRKGYEDFETVRAISVGEKILISKRLTLEQRAALRQALGRGDASGLAPAKRDELYAAVDRGDFATACSTLGGCLPRPSLAFSAVVSDPTRRPPPDAAQRNAELSAPPATIVRLAATEPHVVSEPVEPGDVVVLDPVHSGALRLASSALDPGVVGIVGSAPETIPAGSEAPIALIGTVRCKVDAEYGAIAAGDLLVASPTPGHAMKAPKLTPGTIVGKALEPIDAGTGLIKVMVMLR
jgi:hypothetical protein